MFVTMCMYVLMSVKDSCVYVYTNVHDTCVCVCICCRWHTVHARVHERAYADEHGMSMSMCGFTYDTYMCVTTDAMSEVIFEIVSQFGMDD